MNRTGVTRTRGGEPEHRRRGSSRLPPSLRSRGRTHRIESASDQVRCLIGRYAAAASRSICAYGDELPTCFLVIAVATARPAPTRPRAPRHR